MNRKNRYVHANIVQFIVDIIFLALTFVCSYVFSSDFTDLLVITNYLWILIVFTPIWVFLWLYVECMIKQLFII